MKNNLRLRSALLSVSIASLASHAAFAAPATKAKSKTAAHAPAPAPTPAPIPLDPAQAAMKASIASIGEGLGPSRVLIRKLYETRTYTPIFIINGQPSQAAKDLKTAVETVAPAHGLPVGDYWTPKQEAYLSAPIEPSLVNQAELDLARVYVELAVHISTGRVSPTSISHDVKYSRQPFNGAALPAGIGGEGIGTMLNRIAPQHSLYRQQLSILARLLQIKAQGGFPALVHAKSTLKVGANAPIVSQLKTRLSMLGYHLSNTSSVYDQELSEVIKDVQVNNLTDPTGTIPPGSSATWEYFGASSDRRIQQVEANLEKLRWLPNQLESRHIFINLATSHLYVTDPNLAPQFDSLRDMRIINGRPTRKTPSMRDETSDIVLNPTWGVPTTVFREDKVPMIRDIIAKQGQYGLQQWFYEKHFTVMDNTFTNYIDPMSIDWFSLDPKFANFYIVQQPGYDNALGVAKVMLKNPWSIYMHDTNERQLFPSNLRALSSGCMRMEHPIDMVEYLLQGTQWNRFAIDSFVAQPGETKDKETWVKIPAANKIVLYTMPLTANLGSDGVIRFTRDLYSQNTSILSTLKAAGFYRGQK